MTTELTKLREALRRVKYEAASLADAQVIALEALTASLPAQAVEVDTGPRVLREVFALCEDTMTKMESVRTEFSRGRAFEAKGISRAIGTWFQDEFCGRSHMGEPVTQPAAQATPEPVGKVVAWVYGDDIYWHNAPDLNDHIRASGRPMVFGDTHPAPGVPDGVLDAKYFARNGTGFDTCPTRLLPQSEEARKVDEWWLRYFAAADAQVRKHALTMLAAAQAKGGGNG